MESLESTHRELDSTAERLRTVEAQVSALWGCGRLWLSPHSRSTGEHTVWGGSLSEGFCNGAVEHRRRQSIGPTIVPKVPLL